jgi:hypothetical protein
MKIPKLVYNLKDNIIFCLSLPLFVLAFAILYTPTFGNGTLTDWPHSDHASMSIAIMAAIILITTSLSRFLLWLTTRKKRLSEFEYLIWQFGEVLVACIFCAMFISLFLHYPYFSVLPIAILIGLAVAIFPYTVYWLYAERCERDQRIADAQKTIMELRSGTQHEGPNAIKFTDEKGTVRLIVSADKVISIESAGNYVNILYDKSGQLVKFSLRNTLKAIENLCNSYEIVRCHRSYFVNIHKIKLIKKDSDGFFAELDIDGVPSVPISKLYASDLIDKIE